MIDKILKSLEDLTLPETVITVRKNHKTRFMNVYRINSKIDLHDACFIRERNNRQNYLHYVGENPKDKNEVLYEIKHGLNGAVIWSRKKGERIIETIDRRRHLELISAADAIKDES